jgi:predicted transcriptional regulator
MELNNNTQTHSTDLIENTVNLVVAYVSNNSVPAADLPAVIGTLHTALFGLNTTSMAAEPAIEKPTPAQIRKSITPDALISFIDGKLYKTIKRHLSRNGMTVQQYRERYGLPADYPVTAPAYSARRSELAKSIGLGRKRAPAKAPAPLRAAAKRSATTETISDAPKRRGSKKAAK